ncbi:hypothetical protein [Microbacterium sp.]|uniref:hypothetical protein n=1 Tax=Microbacterium sp. TaxID=51671 RepID=UPI003F9D8FC8
MNTTTQTAQLIAFRVRKGANAEESVRLLDEITAAHSGDNLAHALHYNGFVSLARAEGAAHSLEIERTDEHVRQVAALLPFDVELEADMGANFSGHYAFVVDLGSRGGEDDPHDRAGIDHTGTRPTWWIETAGGETFEDSQLSARTDPVRIAQWLTERARTLGCPAAQITRPEWATVARWEDAHRAAGAWPTGEVTWRAFHTEGDRCTRAETTHDCQRSHDYKRLEAGLSSE